MELFEVTIGLLLVAALLSTLADRIAVPYPAMLALAGAAAAFLPGVPDLALDPDLVLALFVAPVLLDAAYDASPRDLRRNFASVARPRSAPSSRRPTRQPPPPCCAASSPRTGRP